MGSKFVSLVIAYLKINIKNVSFLVSVAEDKLIIIWKPVSQIVKDSFFVNNVSINRKFKKYSLKKVGSSMKAEDYKSQNIKKNNFKVFNKSPTKKYHKILKMQSLNKKRKKKLHKSSNKRYILWKKKTNRLIRKNKKWTNSSLK